MPKNRRPKSAKSVRQAEWSRIEDQIRKDLKEAFKNGNEDPDDRMKYELLDMAILLNEHLEWLHYMSVRYSEEGRPYSASVHNSQGRALIPLMSYLMASLQS